MSGAKERGESANIFCASVSWRRRSGRQSLRSQAVAAVSSGRSTPASRGTGPVTGLVTAPTDRGIGHRSAPACGHIPIIRPIARRTSRLRRFRAPPARVSASGAEAYRLPRVSDRPVDKKMPRLAAGHIMEDVHHLWESLHTAPVCPVRNVWSLRIRKRGPVCTHPTADGGRQRALAAPCRVRNRLSWFCC